MLTIGAVDANTGIGTFSGDIVLAADDMDITQPAHTDSVSFRFSVCARNDAISPARALAEQRLEETEA